jgi:hypothetical protein
MADAVSVVAAASAVSVMHNGAASAQNARPVPSEPNEQNARTSPSARPAKSKTTNNAPPPLAATTSAVAVVSAVSVVIDPSAANAHRVVIVRRALTKPAVMRHRPRLLPCPWPAKPSHKPPWVATRLS